MPKEPVVEEEYDPLDSVTVDPCCEEGNSPVAEGAAPEGTYLVSVRHGGLSLLSETGDGCTTDNKARPSTMVQYLCPLRCYTDVLRYDDFVAALMDNPNPDVSRCSDFECNGQCFKPHTGDWSYHKVVSAPAPRLLECAVVGGLDFGGNLLKVMTSDCRSPFEEWRELYKESSDGN